MRLNRERELQTRDDSFAVDSSESYATVQSVVGSDSDDGSGSGTDGAERHVLLLGGWAPPQVRVRPVLDQAASYVGSQPWQDLSGDLLVFAPDADPVTLEASTRPVARTATADEGGSLVWWFVLGIAVLLVALAVQLVTTVRRDRATAAAVQDRPGPNGSTPARTGSRPSRPSGPASTRPTSGSKPGSRPGNKPGSTSSTSGGTSRSGTKPAAGSGTKPGGDGASGKKPRDPKPSTRRQRPAGS